MRRHAHFRLMFVLLIASKPIHSTFALSHALHAGNFPSHFCFLDRQRVQELIALATLYCCSSRAADDGGILFEEDWFRLAFGLVVFGRAGSAKEGGGEVDDGGGYGA